MAFKKKKIFIQIYTFNYLTQFKKKEVRNNLAYLILTIRKIEQFSRF